MSALDDLKNILRSRGGFEAVEARATDTQIRLEGRVPPNAQSHWLITSAVLMDRSEEGAGWSLDYSKHFFRRQLPSGRKSFFAHRLIFQAESIESVVGDIIQTIQRAPQPSRVELQEFPLTGAGSHRQQSHNGRGAFSVDKAPLGPMAVQAMRGGGVR
jgi:hypothetical protein